MSTPRISNRSKSRRSQNFSDLTFSLCRAAPLLALLLAPPASALIIDKIGAPGPTGTSGVPYDNGGNGGNGGTATTAASSSDLVNAITASGGRGGDGGDSNVLQGGDGGTGGAASAALQTANQNVPPTYVEISNTVTAVGGNGGDGGGGGIPLLDGRGGAGGAAAARGTELGTPNIDPINGGWIGAEFLTISATGGNGGRGRDGGAGGTANAAGIMAPAHQSQGSTTLVNATGGNGGDGEFQGGRGANATAAVRASLGGNPAYHDATAAATGGNGGNSGIGLYGDGGNASAKADGGFAARDLGLTVTARASGGDSGGIGAGGLALSGRGGNAYAVATSRPGSNPGGASPQAFATGGDGRIRGGYAIAIANNAKQLMGGYATATATGGSGPRAGAAIASAVSTADWIGNSAIATANFNGPLVKQVQASGQTFTFDVGQQSSIIDAQARVGDTSGLRSSVPTVAGDLTVRAIAPTKSEATTALTGNSNIAKTFATGAVWGMGEFDSHGIYDRSEATTSFVLDTADIANPQHLWLGLFDTDLPDTTNASFHFALSGEGTTLFQHDFVGNDFLTYFNDRTFDLGDWTHLLSSDGLLNIDVSFSGYAPDIQFAFGQARDNSTAVPEPSSLLLLAAGLIGVVLSRNLQRRTLQ